MIVSLNYFFCFIFPVLIGIPLPDLKIRIFLLGTVWFFHRAKEKEGKGLNSISALYVRFKGGSNAINESRTPEEAGINVADPRRIQNTATRADQDIVVVGSRTNGTTTTTSDWDYLYGY